MFVLLALYKKSLGNFFFEFLTEQNPVFKFVLREDGGLSKTHVARHTSPTLLVCIVISVVANHAPSGGRVSYVEHTTGTRVRFLPTEGHGESPPHPPVHTTQKLSLHWQSPRKSSCCVPTLRRPHVYNMASFGLSRRKSR